MVEIGIRGGICHTIHQYAAANKKIMTRAIITSHLLGCKQSTWMSNVSKIACRWF